MCSFSMTHVQYTLVMWMCLLGIAGTATSREGDHGFLFYSVGSEIRRVSLGNGKDVSFVKNPKGRVVGVSMSITPLNVYYTNINVGQKSIMRRPAIGGYSEIIADTGLLAPEILAVDYITGNVYFIDKHKKHMGVCSANGSYCTVLLNSSVLDDPGDLVLYPADGVMFWSDYGKKPSIWTAVMDGSRPKIILSEDLDWPKGLAIDYLKRRLYWIDSKDNGIESINFDGSNRIHLIRMEDYRLRSLAILGDKLYYSDWKRKKIESINLNGSAERTLVNASDFIYDIEIFHSTLKPRLLNPCYRHQCNELCLLAGNRRYTCACRLGQVLSSNAHTCSPKQESSYLAIAAGNKILYYHRELLGKARIDETVTPLRMSRIAYNRHTGNLIADDQFTNALYSIDLRTDEFRMITTPFYSQYLSGIDINLRNNIISWSSTNIRRIDEISLQNGAKWSYNFVDVPLDILSVPKHKKSIVVFKSDVTGYRIEWLYFRGPRHPKIIISNLIGPKISLALDRYSQRVYFADEGTGNIESFSVNTECLKRNTDCYIDRRLVCSSVTKPVSLAIVDRKVYWTSRDSNILQWVEMDDEYQAIESKVLPIKNDFGIVDIVAIENFDVPDWGTRQNNA